MAVSSLLLAVALLGAAFAPVVVASECKLGLDCPPSLLSEVNQGSVVCRKDVNDTVGFLMREVKDNGDLVVDDSRWTTTGYPLSEQSGCWYWISGDITDSPQNTTNNAGSFLRIVIKSINGVTASNNTVMKLISDAATSIFKITLKEYTDDSGKGRGCVYSEVTIDTGGFMSTLRDNIDKLDVDDAKALNTGGSFAVVWGYRRNFWSTASRPQASTPYQWACTSCDAGTQAVRPVSYTNQEQLYRGVIGAASHVQSTLALALPLLVLALQCVYGR